MSRLGFALLATTLLAWSAPRAEAQCGDLGGIGVFVGGVIGESAVLVGSFVFPGIAESQDPSLGPDYWSGFGWTLLGGTAGVITGAAISLDSGCEGAYWLPGVLGIGAAAIATTIWALAASDGGERAAHRLRAPPLLVDLVPVEGGGIGARAAWRW